MLNSKASVESLISQAEAALQVRGNNSDAPSIDQVLAEIQSAVMESADTRGILGPFIARLSAAKASAAASPIDWIPVLQGYLAIGHRPQIKKIKTMRILGTTHVLTLLSESEGAKDIGSEVRRAGLDWMWLPLTSGAPPSDERLAAITDTFDDICSALDRHARIYIHCSAGIHRTGMITYAFLRHAKFSGEAAIKTLSALRQKTADGVGVERKRWGEQFA